MKQQSDNSDHHKIIVKNIASLIAKGNAHASLDDALDAIPFSVLGKVLPGLHYSIWQLAEHIRIAQCDLLEFSRNAKHVSPEWPEGYWPQEAAPASETAWNKCITKIKEERKTFIDLVTNAGNDLYKSFEYGDGQSLLKEALVLADHNAYHTAEIIVIRRLLGVWKK